MINLVKNKKILIKSLLVTNFILFSSMIINIIFSKKNCSKLELYFK
ncbi:hypothetical protein [Fusobacterium sp. MFO224]